MKNEVFTNKSAEIVTGKPITNNPAIGVWLWNSNNLRASMPHPKFQSFSSLRVHIMLGLKHYPISRLIWLFTIDRSTIGPSGKKRIYSFWPNSCLNLDCLGYSMTRYWFWASVATQNHEKKIIICCCCSWVLLPAYLTKIRLKRGHTVLWTWGSQIISCCMLQIQSQQEIRSKDPSK